MIPLDLHAVADPRFGRPLSGALDQGNGRSIGTRVELNWVRASTCSNLDTFTALVGF